MLSNQKGFIKKIIAVCLAVLLCFTTALPAFAENLTEEQKNTLDQKVNSLKAKQSEINATKNTIAEINAAMQELDNTIADLDGRMAETKEEIARLDVQLYNQETEMGKRASAMYMLGQDGYVEMLFSADTFAELLARIEQIRSVIQSDRDCVKAIEQTKKEIEAGITSLETDKANVESLKAQKNAILITNQALLEMQQLQYDAEKASGDQLAASLGFSGIDAYAGELAWPIDLNNPSAFSISDWFGPRSWAATSGVGSTDHHGLDITAGNCKEILAAASGVVVKAEYTDGYGNVVVIDHGKKQGTETTLHTLYAHQSSFIVSVGQTVSQGEVIGYIGSTGPSTGPHLHFEVWENKVPVDPMSYFEQYRDRCVFNG